METILNDISKTHDEQRTPSPSQTSLSVYAVLALSFIAAGAVRLYNIESPKPYFYPSRQYESFLIARSFYFESIDTVADWQKQIAKVNKRASEGKGPPLTEYLVSLVYRATGGESHWASCLICSVFWLIGGVFVFATVKKFTPYAAAAIATAFYLLVPFGIFMTRSFQPESLMMMMFLAGIYTIFNYYEKPSTKRLMIMAIVCGLAILVKVSIIFPIWTAFIAGGICKNGLRRTIFSLQHIVFELIGIIPGLIYYSYLAFFGDKVQMVAQGTYAPEFLWTWQFWAGWLGQLGTIIGFIALVGAIIGVLLVRDKTVRGILIGLAVGYFAYSLIFTYHTLTHEYYQVHVVPIAALGLSPAIALALKQLGQKRSRFRRATIVGGLLLLIVLFSSLVSIKVSAFRSKNKYIRSCLTFAYKCFGLKPQYLSQVSNDYADYVEMAKEIGRAVGHSGKTITLGKAVALWYYGQYAGHKWPFHRNWPFPDTVGSLGTGAKWKKYEGLSAEELFERRFSKFSPEYFIVVAFGDFEKQETLREFLYGKFEIIIQNDKYLIFDLTTPRD